MNYERYLEIINRLYKNIPFNRFEFSDSEIKIISYHNLQGFFYQYLNSDILTSYTKEIISNDFLEQKRKFEIYKREINELINLFNSNNIRHIFLKAFSLNNIYNDYIRRFNDIDLLINYEEIPSVIKSLQYFGYEFGCIDYNTNKFKPASRQQILFSKLNTHELCEMVKKVNNIYIKLDLNFLFQWKGNKNKQIEFEELYNNSQVINNRRILNNVYNILHLCCHFYNETVNFVFNYDMPEFEPQELKIYRLFDILYLLEETDENQQNEMINIALKHQLGNQVKYVFKIIDQFFPSTLPQTIYDFAFSNSQIDNDINIYLKRNNTFGLWPISIFDRSFNLELKKQNINKLDLQ